MSVSQRSKRMKKSSKTSKRSKKLINNKKSKKNIKKMRGGVSQGQLVVGKVYTFTYNYINAMYPDGKSVNVPKTNNKYLRYVAQIGRGEENRLEFQNMDSNEVFQIDADYEDDFILQ